MIVLGLAPFLTGRALDVNDSTALFSLFGIIPRLFIPRYLKFTLGWSNPTSE
jgi:hypothetical protein